uniref:Chaperone protein DnaK n=1 Tax=Nonomuraea gerenzanensis TaxID=93944 RepID=A0A1M4DXZ4_9ACTN|nr:Chaperone protein DnaK [Nonomuraea gerenzanensis]
MPPTTELTDPDVGYPATDPMPHARQKRFRSLLIGGTSVALAVIVAGGVLVASRQGDEQAAELAGSLFAAGTASGANGRQLELNGAAATGTTVVVAGGEDADSGYRTEFFLSKDAGRTFARAQVRTAKGEPPVAGEIPRYLAAGPTGWVALGDRVGGSVVWTSPDGATWTRQPDATASLAFGPRDRVADVAWTGKGFTAVGQTSDKGDFTDAAPVVWLSADGRSWERRAGWRLHPPTGGTLALTDVASVKDAIVVRGESSTEPYDITWRSTDAGETWQAFAVPGESDEPELSFAATSATMLAVRRNDSDATTYTSPDGVRWTTAAKIEVPGFRRVLRLTAASGAAVAAIETDSGVQLVRTTDGRSWQPAGTATGPAPTGAPTGSPAGSPSGSPSGAADETSSAASSAASSGAEVRDAVVAGDNTVVVGADAADGTTGALLAVRDKAGKDVPAGLPETTGSGKVVDALGAADGRVVAVGGANGEAAVWTSADGAGWQHVQDKNKALTGQGRQRLTGVAPGFAGWLAVGSSGRAPGHPLVVTSADGESWRRADGAPAFQPEGKNPLIPRGVSAGPDGYVIVGEDGYGAGTWWSPDLKTWERGAPAGADNLVGTPTTRRWMQSVTSGLFGFVAAGGVTDPNAYGGVFVRRPTVWISPDGRKWSLVRLPIPAGVNEGWLPYIASNDDVLVTAGTAVTGNGTGTSAFGYASLDGGRSWQPISLPVVAGEQSSVTAVAATPEGFVVAGTVGRPGDVVLWTSADGRSWQPEQPRGTGMSGPGDQRLTSFTTVDGTLVGVGSTATGHGDEPTVWRRPLSTDASATP